MDEDGVQSCLELENRAAIVVPLIDVVQCRAQDLRPGRDSRRTDRQAGAIPLLQCANARYAWPIGSPQARFGLWVADYARRGKPLRR